MDGYPAVQALAKTNLFPPAEYNPTPAPPPPSPADLAAQTVASTPDLKTLSLSDQEFILFNGKPEDAQKVWDVMKGRRVEVPGIVVSATADSVQLAVTEDNKQSKKADFTVNMKTPLKIVPAVDAIVTYDATFDSYSPNPPMITLSDGEAPAKAKPAPSPSPPRRTLTRNSGESSLRTSGLPPPYRPNEGCFIAFLPETYSVQLAFMVLSMVCWGSWANTIKLTPGWPIQLFYWDYVVGILLGSLAWGVTLGGGPESFSRPSQTLTQDIFC